MDLKNDHNVYVLGAGFSRDRGLPLMADFLNYMRDAHPWLINKKRMKEAKAIQDIIEFRKKSASVAYRVHSNLENIEELFSLASAKPNNDSLMASIRLAIAATINFCEHTKNHNYARLYASDENCNIKHHKTSNSVMHGHTESQVLLYDAIVASLCGACKAPKQKGQNTFITFNYDTILENSLLNINIPFKYGFSKSEVFEMSNFGNSRDPSSIPVYKLHGSTNWAFTRGKTRSFRVFNSYKEILLQGYTPELIPPTWRKVFSQNLSEVWDGAVQQLQSATRIIIIGFSIPETDLHFKHLMAAGLQNNISLREVRFVSPENLQGKAQKVFREKDICKFREINTRLIVNSDNSFLREIGREHPEDFHIHA